MRDFTAGAGFAAATKGRKLGPMTQANYERLFNPTEEHALLRQTVAEFARREVEPQAAEFDDKGQLNVELFRKTARHWANVHAGAKHKQEPGFTALLQQLKDMGVDESAARVALSSCGWDINKATEQLFS